MKKSLNKHTSLFFLFVGLSSFSSFCFADHAGDIQCNDSTYITPAEREVEKLLTESKNTIDGRTHYTLKTEKDALSPGETAKVLGIQTAAGEFQKIPSILRVDLSCDIEKKFSVGQDDSIGFVPTPTITPTYKAYLRATFKASRMFLTAPPTKWWETTLKMVGAMSPDYDTTFSQEEKILAMDAWDATQSATASSVIGDFFVIERFESNQSPSEALEKCAREYYRYQTTQEPINDFKIVRVGANVFFANGISKASTMDEFEKLKSSTKELINFSIFDHSNIREAVAQTTCDVYTNSNDFQTRFARLFIHFDMNGTEGKICRNIPNRIGTVSAFYLKDEAPQLSAIGLQTEYTLVTEVEETKTFQYYNELTRPVLSSLIDVEKTKLSFPYAIEKIRFNKSTHSFSRSIVDFQNFKTYALNYKSLPEIDTIKKLEASTYWAQHNFDWRKWKKKSQSPELASPVEVFDLVSCQPEG